VCDVTKIQETVRVTSLPVIVDGDTGYGSPMNVKRTVESFAAAGAAGVMIEDQTWPKSGCSSFPCIYLLHITGLDHWLTHDRDAMARCVKELHIPMLANIIEGGMTENLSAKDLAGLGFAAVAYPWTLVAAKLKAIRDALEGLKRSMVEGGPPPMILGYSDVCEGVGFNKYWVSWLKC
jgi:methylisocitrate lyase